MSEKPNLITYAEAYKLLRSIQPELEPGPCGEYAEFLAWATVNHGGSWIEIFEPNLYDELEKEYENLKAEGIFNIQHG